MKEESTHTSFFSAIMVVDLVGSSASAPRQQNKAEGNRDLFWEVINKQVPDQSGCIIHTYADGAVNIFNSVLGAVYCALKIRGILKNESVPIRIGLHKGVVKEKGGKFYGPPMHISCLLKSMCRAGSILISDKVFEDIRDQRNIYSTRVGCFAFTNGQDTIKIYSIVQNNPAIQIDQKYARWSKVESLQVRNNLIQPYLSNHHPELLN